jgi:hypothetical protein
MANRGKGRSRWAIQPTTQTTIAVDIPQKKELTLRQDCGMLPTVSHTGVRIGEDGTYSLSCLG